MSIATQLAGWAAGAPQGPDAVAPEVAAPPMLGGDAGAPNDAAGSADAGRTPLPSPDAIWPAGRRAPASGRRIDQVKMIWAPSAMS